MVRKLAFQQQLIPVTMKRLTGNINSSWWIRTEYPRQKRGQSSSTEIPENGRQNCTVVFHGVLYISQDQDSRANRLVY